MRGDRGALGASGAVNAIMIVNVLLYPMQVPAASLLCPGASLMGLVNDFGPTPSRHTCDCESVLHLKCRTYHALLLLPALNLFHVICKLRNNTV